jgi:uncharacterized protein (TIGR02217 family)
MTAFIEQRLLDCAAFGTVFAPTYRTREVRLMNGKTRRNQDWSLPKYRFTVVYANLDQTDQRSVISAFHACGGSAIGFRLKDWSDFEGSCVLTASATGSPQSVQLFKTYTFGSGTRTRLIRKPVAGTVTLSATTPPTAVSVDTATGIVTFTGTVGQTVSAAYEFDVPVRFESDELGFSIDDRSGDTLLLNANVPLIEDSNA